MKWKIQTRSVDCIKVNSDIVLLCYCIIVMQNVTFGKSWGEKVHGISLFYFLQLHVKTVLSVKISIKIFI